MIDKTGNIAGDALRARDWRWQYITFWIEKGKRMKRTSLRRSFTYQCRDKYVLTGFKHFDDYLARINPNAKPNDLRRCFGCNNRNVQQAHHIFTTNRSTRWAIEALIVGNSTVEDIAAKLGVAPATIEFYEALFFDVRDRLHNTLWVATELLSPETSGTPALEHDFVWKAMAYHYGIEAFWAMLTMADVSEDMHAKLESLRKSQCRKNLVRATLLRPVNSYTAHEIIDEHIQEKGLEIQERRLPMEQKAADGLAGLGDAAQQIIGVLQQGNLLRKSSGEQGAIECRVVEVMRPGQTVDIPQVMAMRAPIAEDRQLSAGEAEPLAPLTPEERQKAATEHRSALQDKKKLLAKQLRDKK